MSFKNESFVYRICTKKEYDDLNFFFCFEGNSLDKESGFIHLSMESQIEGTLKKYFKKEKKLMLLKLSTELLGDNLRWEKSRNNLYFPHYYGKISFKQIIEIIKL